MSGKAGPIRLGIAGLGVGTTMVLPGIAACANAKIVAAADIRPGALTAFRDRFGGRTFDSVDALCRDPEVDAIWIGTPNQYHREHTVRAAKAGKHIVCTKPMALSVEECAEMCDAADHAGVILLCGQTWSMSPHIQAMHQVASSGRLGRLIGINCWFYTDWLLKPRLPEELDEALGGGVVYRHAPHLIDTVRLLGGGKVRSVRASVGRWMKQRPCPGNFSAFLDFEDGTPATIVYNGYGYFDTSELTWDIGNRWYSQEERPALRRALGGNAGDQEAAKDQMRLGASTRATDAPSGRSSALGPKKRQPWFGITVASFDRGDLRQSPNGLYLYTDDGRQEIPVEETLDQGSVEMDELYDAVVNGKPPVHDGRWAMATLEVGSAMVQSTRERREILLQHQVAARG